MSSNAGDDLLALLAQGGHITATGRRLAERFVARWDVSPYHALLMTRLFSEAELANTLSSLFQLSRLYNLSTLTLAKPALGVVGFERARAWECIPLVDDAGRIDIVFADPTRKDRIDEIKQLLNQETSLGDITLAVAERSDIVRAIDELYPLSAQLPSLFGDRRVSEEAPTDHQPSAMRKLQEPTKP